MKKDNSENISNTLLKGRITELLCIQKILSMGYIVSTPDVPCQYDIIIDTGDRLLKVQIKSCRLNKQQTGIEFNTSSITHNNNGYTTRLYTKNMVDYFCTWYENNCYLIPFEECGNKTKCLRLVPTRNGQVKNISFAEDYLIEKILYK